MAFQRAAHFGPVLGRDHEMAAVRHQVANLPGHAAAQIRIARAEDRHYGLGVFAQQAKEPFLDALFHSSDPVPRKTAQAASGVNAATRVSGAYP